MKKYLAVVILAVFSLWGCKENSTEPTTITDLSSTTEEAAYNVSTQLSESASGVSDQIGDAFTLAFPTSFAKMLDGGKDTTFKTRVWDNDNKLWTVTVDRKVPDRSTRVTFTFTRVYTIQYLDKNNEPMMYWKVGNDTAYTIRFKILEGTSYFKNPILIHRLLNLVADLTITNANKPIVTINGTMKREGSDTVAARNLTKTHNYKLDLTFQDVTGPRKNKLALQNKLSGTIAGTYEAVVSYKLGDSYKEETITKVINIQLDGTGKYELRMGDKTNQVRFGGHLGVPGISRK